ncbi:MAG: hypothetical protein JWO36_3800 [Myxococcales bacterium]|nr:hypothetical protein [Myxococcales bacterium]
MGIESSWSLPSRIAFRFGIIFAALVIFPFPFDVLPGTHWIATEYARMWNVLMPWFGERVLGETDPVRFQLFACSICAAVATISWSVVDREARGHTWLAQVARSVLRFWIASAMLAFGVDKLFANDFVALGEGIGACSAAAFLFWQRTAPIGCLLAGALLTNIAAHMIGTSGSIDLAIAELLVATLVLFLAEAPRAVATLFGSARRAREDLAAVSLPWRVTRIVAKALVIGCIVFYYVRPHLANLV